ncbi:hypothetical protein V8C86DRAFT_2442796 [Haematococcus lacustris]
MRQALQAASRAAGAAGAAGAGGGVAVPPVAVLDPAIGTFPLDPRLSIEQFGDRVLSRLHQCLTPKGQAQGGLAVSVGQEHGCYFQKLEASSSSSSSNSSSSKKQTGYLYMKVAPGYHEVAHRLVLWAFDGPPQEPHHEVLHVCGSRHCLNPSHLVWGSKADNKALSPTQLQKKRKALPEETATQLKQGVKKLAVELAKKRQARFMVNT